MPEGAPVALLFRSPLKSKGGSPTGRGVEPSSALSGAPLPVDWAKSGIGRLTKRCTGGGLLICSCVKAIEMALISGSVVPQ